MRDESPAPSLQRGLDEANAALLRCLRRIETGNRRQGFLRRLGDAMRPLVDPIAMQETAMRLLAEFLEAGRAFFYRAEWADGQWFHLIETDNRRDPEAPSLIGRHALANFSPALHAGLDLGRRVVVADARVIGLPEHDAALCLKYGIGAVIIVPIVTHGVHRGGIAVIAPEAREWTDDDVSLVGEVADRSWELVKRADAESALRAAEDRHAFLLRLSDAMRNEQGADAVIVRALALLAGQLRLDRCFLAVLTGGAPAGRVEFQFNRPDLGALPTVIHEDPFSDSFGSGADPTVVLADRLRHPGLGDAAQASLRRINVRSLVASPLRTGPGRSIRALVAASEAPRAWQASDVALVGEVAERLWIAAERARAEAALRDSESRLAAIFAGVPVGLAMIDAQGRVVLANRRARSLLPDDALPTRSADRVSRWRAEASDKERIRPEDYPGARALRGVSTVPGMEMIYTDDDGQARWIAVSAVPLRDDGGAVTGLVAAMADIDAQKRNAAALRESEGRFRQFAAASSGALWIRDAATLDLEYASPVIAAIYGVEPDALAGGVAAWSAMVVPEDRASALSHLERMRGGDTVVHEFRIQRAYDGSFRWIRNIGFPLLDAEGTVQRVGGIFEDITDAKLLLEHQGILLSELQHRVRNIVAVVRSINRRTADSATSVEDYASLMEGRLDTFAHVQTLLTRAANAGVALDAIVRDELDAMAVHAGQFEVEGTHVMLSPKAAETMTLAVHELATNALKHGALSGPQGRVRIRWTVERRGDAAWLRFDWDESGAPARPAAGPRRTGFGTELIEQRIPYELQGRGAVIIAPEGARCHLEFPLRAGASILETDAPKRANVFGGALDMSGQADLAGHCILVVEDDYYIAADTARALKTAGATVLGPCPTEEDARRHSRDAALSGAILDINLNGHRSFELARELKERGVPFVFVTGYDESAIPDEFKGVTLFQKPVQFRRVIGALAQALGGPPASRPMP